VGVFVFPLSTGGHGRGKGGSCGREWICVVIHEKIGVRLFCSLNILCLPLVS